MSTATATRHTPETLSDEQLLAIVTMKEKVWPTEGGFDPAGALAYYRERHSRRLKTVIYAVWEGDRTLATAEIFERRILFLDTDEGMAVGALAGVCSDPEVRGRGYGWAVAKGCLGEVDGGTWPAALFQTGVPGFYEKLGARLIDNPFIDGQADDPRTGPWWDPHVMIYPAVARWPEGTIDLNGPAY